MSDSFETTMRKQIAEMPRIRFIHEWDWMVGPGIYALGFLWDRNFDTQPGEMVYQKRIVLRFPLRVSLEWHVRL